jgi:hypothetical protein
MAKYAKYAKQRQLKPERPHPVWRGIGCLLMIIVPTMAYALAVIVVPIMEATNKLPYELFQPIRFPDWVLRTKVLGGAAHFISSIDNLGALLIFFFIALIVLAGLFSFLYTLVYQKIGPPRYGVLDAPPSRHRPGKHSR